MVSGPTVHALRSAAHAVTSTDHRTALVAIQTAQDALDAAKAHHLAELERTAEYELDGASTVAAWARDHLRIDARQTRSLINADTTMRELPAVGEAAIAGQVRLDHVKLFTFGLKHIGHRVVTDAEPWLLAVATTHEPVQLRRVVRALRDAVYPEALDEAWINGMAKEDIQLSAVPEGWHLTGFLKTETGAKLKTVLESLSIPVTANDDRTVAERRVAGLDRLLSSVLEAGLPTSKGIRPQLSVIVGIDTLHEAMTAQPGHAQPAGEPAELAGFGPIGPQLLSYLACTGDITPILTSGDDIEQAQILNVGDTIRLATPAQRKAVIARQGRVCAAPGCTHTHLEIHHTTWWSNGGRTDLDGLIGICSNMGPPQKARSGGGALVGPPRTARHRSLGSRPLRTHHPRRPPHRPHPETHHPRTPQTHPPSGTHPARTRPPAPDTGLSLSPGGPARRDRTTPAPGR